MMIVQGNWRGADRLRSSAYTCGYCNRQVASAIGFGDHAGVTGSDAYGPIFVRMAYICPHCGNVTQYVIGGEQTPGVAYGNEVMHLPREIADLYREARNCIYVAAYTSSVLACRKLLMNVAFDKGAGENLSFKEYVRYLADKKYIHRESLKWIDHIRNKANEATHEIPAISEGDAKELIAFTEMLLKLVYEFPRRIQPEPEGSET